MTVFCSRGQNLEFFHGHNANVSSKRSARNPGDFCRETAMLVFAAAAMNLLKAGTMNWTGDSKVKPRPVVASKNRVYMRRWTNQDTN